MTLSLKDLNTWTQSIYAGEVDENEQYIHVLNVETCTTTNRKWRALIPISQIYNHHKRGASNFWNTNSVVRDVSPVKTPDGSAGILFVRSSLRTCTTIYLSIECMHEFIHTCMIDRICMHEFSHVLLHDRSNMHAWIQSCTPAWSLYKALLCKITITLT